MSDRNKLINYWLRVSLAFVGLSKVTPQVLARVTDSVAQLNDDEVAELLLDIK